MRCVFLLLTICSLLIFSCKPKKSDAEKLIEEIETQRLVEKRMAEIKDDIAKESLQTMDSCPVKITDATVYTDGSEHRVRLKFMNDSGKDVDGIKAGMFFYNNFEEPIGASFETNQMAVMIQEVIKNKATDFFSWNIDNFSAATKVKAYIKEIHFTDGTKWNYEDFKK